MNIQTRRFRPGDAEKVAALIARTLRESNSRDYSSDYIEADIRRLSPEFFVEKAKQTHFYVFYDSSQLVGTGAIGPYWGSNTEFSLFNIFVLPEYQGAGIGRLIIETLEKDDYFKHADRVEIPASITGLSFYQHMGYDFKNGDKTIDDEGLYRLEKFPDHQFKMKENLGTEITFVKAKVEEMTIIQQMYHQAFKTIYLRYRDDETDPYLESLASLEKKAQRPGSEFFFCEIDDGTQVGMIPVISDHIAKEARISPLCVLPQFQGRGVAQKILAGIEQQFKDIMTWYVDTIAEEAELVHLYKKAGYSLIAGKQKAIKSGMSLAYFVKHIS